MKADHFGICRLLARECRETLGLLRIEPNKNERVEHDIWPIHLVEHDIWPFVLQYDSAEWEPAFLRQAREFPFLPLLPREASK